MQELIKVVEQHKQEIEMTVLKLSPPVAVTAYTIAGHPLSEWLIVSTLIYTWLQICLLLRKMWLERQAAIVCKRDDEPPKE